MNARFVPITREMMPQKAERGCVGRALVWCGGFIAGLLLAGCETVSESAPAGTPTPSANVKKYQAWKDAEMLAQRQTGREALVGGGDSMKPIYGDNTMLVVTPIAYDDLQPGMTVVYTNRRGRRVAHQLLEKLSEGWRVQGFNNAEEDSELVTPQNLIGVVYASLSSEEP